jgi:multidrug resistance efflux pump
MDDKLRKDVEAVVAKIFSEKEEADIRRKTEEALSKSATTIDELTTELEAKNTEVEELEAKISESEETAKNLQTEQEAAQKEVEEAKTKLEESEKVVEEMQKDKATELRMAELTEAGVVSDEEAQASKVRDMSDEEFVSYKEELTSLRAAIVAQLEKAEEKEEAEEEAEEKEEEAEEKEEEAEEKEEAEEEAEEKEDAEEEDDVTPPANVDPGQAISAALNMEIFPSEDVTKKYQDLGKAMASLMVDKIE